MIIRKAEYKDLETINNIYNDAIITRSTADTIPVTFQAREEWFKNHDPNKYPVFVAENNGEILGWLSFSPYRGGRYAVRHSAEISYYVATNHQKKGVGSEFVKYALKIAPDYNLKNLFGIILETNIGSIKLMYLFY